MEREISQELVESTRKWLGKDGLAFFKELKEKHNDYSPVLNDGGIGQSVPHPVHFREGMQVRNHMRGTDLCKDWGDHDLDDSWVALITKVIEDKMSLKDEYYGYILDKKEVSKPKEILFKIVQDFTDRRGLRQGWESIDNDIQEEILQTWLKIIEDIKAWEKITKYAEENNLSYAEATGEYLTKFPGERSWVEKFYYRQQ